MNSGFWWHRDDLMTNRVWWLTDFGVLYFGDVGLTLVTWGLCEWSCEYEGSACHWQFVWPSPRWGLGGFPSHPSGPHTAGHKDSTP